MYKSEWLTFFKARWLEIMILISMILLGSVYACYHLSAVDGVNGEVVEYFLYRNRSISLECFLLTFLSHLKTVCFVWLFGLLTYFKRINIFLIGAVIFAYSFTITSFLGSVGINNNFIIWLNLSLQGTLAVSYLVNFYEFTLQKVLKIKKYAFEILKGFVVCLCVTVLGIL